MEEQLKAKIAELEGTVREFSVRTDKLYTENRDLASQNRELIKEKEKLLTVINNLSIALANLGGK